MSFLARANGICISLVSNSSSSRSPRPLHWSAGAAINSVDLGTPLPRFSLLHEGTHHYLRYVKSGDSNAPIDIWTRTARFEKSALHITQRWDGVNPPSTRTFDSWFDTGTFRPRTHERVSEREGKRLVEGFAFAPDKITGIKELAENLHQDLSVESPEPTFNFETDIETLQTLPLAAGYETSINFYHPGGRTAPQRYLFKVTGSGTIAGPGGPVDCWVVTTDYNRAGEVSTFWFAKATQLMVRQESPMGGGKVLVKTLID